MAPPDAIGKWFYVFHVPYIDNSYYLLTYSMEQSPS
jgi:hypothetical protein